MKNVLSLIAALLLIPAATASAQWGHSASFGNDFVSHSVDSRGTHSSCANLGGLGGFCLKQDSQGKGAGVSLDAAIPISPYADATAEYNFDKDGSTTWCGGAQLAARGANSNAGAKACVQRKADGQVDAFIKVNAKIGPYGGELETPHRTIVKP